MQTKAFQSNIEKLKQLEDKRNSDQPLTNYDNLARIIMMEELGFDFE